mmetsp:Transcript_19969/g.33435  ORF Transcript_19969/g.33435 Transcript_19969/m.33435 type:complete len:383 (+) Transcript_19969:120-1268(+)|eukprot:CAMPEP_0174955382 /NCGR_PEP_ID=MMETSP0004_2-20121128/950_1 /TAXON_ID=420556 /ORGANISM="Ochromonas sp., Strain CCMP1393" /LENGTH=382 /DNA_ID=CAMNT_0016203303 /DNA_START=126 /DNA_END=1274 /DNA_ORIENTATION=+
MSTFTHYRVNNEHQVPELAGAVTGVQHQSDGSYIETLEKKLKINITSLSENDIEFDLIGVDASIANALRRIMLAEVPTIAIEHVWIAVNNSIIQDEVLAHRVGLIPIKADPSKLQYVENEEMTDKDTLVFHFDVECSNTTANANASTAADGAAESSADDNNNVVNASALSGELKWLPQGAQLEMFPEGDHPRAVHDDIVVAKLKPGQRIEFEAHCRKGVGKDHTKYSPVATASYRLLPDIVLNTPITGNDAEELKNLCPMDVFDIEDLAEAESTTNKISKNRSKGKSNSSTATTGTNSGDGAAPVSQAVVARPRNCTMCRECIRHGNWREKVELRRKNDHFLFSVESTGCMPPETVVREAISIFKNKASKFVSLVEEYEAQA